MRVKSDPHVIFLNRLQQISLWVTINVSLPASISRVSIKISHYFQGLKTCDQYFAFRLLSYIDAEQSGTKSKVNIGHFKKFLYFSVMFRYLVFALIFYQALSSWGFRAKRVFDVMSSVLPWAAFRRRTVMWKLQSAASVAPLNPNTRREVR